MKPTHGWRPAPEQVQRLRQECRCLGVIAAIPCNHAKDVESFGDPAGVVRRAKGDQTVLHPLDGPGVVALCPSQPPGREQGSSPHGAGVGRRRPSARSAQVRPSLKWPRTYQNRCSPAIRRCAASASPCCSSHVSALAEIVVLDLRPLQPQPLSQGPGSAAYDLLGQLQTPLRMSPPHHFGFTACVNRSSPYSLMVSKHPVARLVGLRVLPDQALVHQRCEPVEEGRTGGRSRAGASLLTVLRRLPPPPPACSRLRRPPGVGTAAAPPVRGDHGSRRSRRALSAGAPGDRVGHPSGAAAAAPGASAVRRAEGGLPAPPRA